MNKFLTLVTALTLTVTSCRSQGNFKMTKSTFSVDGFTGVVASGGDFEVILKQGKKEDVVLNVSENWRKFFTVEVKNKVLHITMANTQQKGRAVFTITTPEITNITSFGPCDIKVGTLETKSPFHITCQGSSDIDIAKLIAKSLDVRVLGSGDVDLNAVNCKENVALKVEGSGDFSAIKLECRSLNNEVWGSGDIDLGTVTCKGDAKFLVQGSGDASVDKLICNTLDNSVWGSGEVDIDNANSAVIKNQVNGSGSVKIEGLSGGRITGDLYGSGSLTLAGSCEELKGSGAGTSTLNIRSLKFRSPITFATYGQSQILQ